MRNVKFERGSKDKPVRNTELCNYNAFVNSNTCSQMYAQVKHSLAHLQDLIPLWLVPSPILTKTEIKSCKCAREVYVVYTCINLAMCV